VKDCWSPPYLLIAHPRMCIWHTKCKLQDIWGADVLQRNWIQSSKHLLSSTISSEPRKGCFAKELKIMRSVNEVIIFYRYNPKHLCPKLNSYGDNGQRKVWFSLGSTHCTCQLTSLIDVCPWLRSCSISAVFVAPAVQAAMLSECVTYSAWNSKDSYDMVCKFFVVWFNGFMSLTS
jgi:hypothetical protein